MIYTMIFLYIISSLFVLDLGIVVLKQIRLESEDHKASLGVLIGLILTTIIPVVNALSATMGIMVILVDLEARDVYIKHSKIVQFFNIRVLGIHPKYKVPRDPSVWTKTPHEKELVKECRHRYGRGIKKY